MSLDTAPYAGRTVDLVAFYGYDAGDGRELTQALALDGGAGAVVTGVQKLVQRFLAELFTVKGSQLYAPARGCAFLSDARRGAWRTAADVSRSFYASLVDVKKSLQAAESGSEPADEAYGSAELLGVDLSQDRVVLRVAVTSAAGTSRVVYSPLPLTA